MVPNDDNSAELKINVSTTKTRALIQIDKVLKLVISQLDWEPAYLSSHTWGTSRVKCVGWHKPRHWLSWSGHLTSTPSCNTSSQCPGRHITLWHPISTSSNTMNSKPIFCPHPPLVSTQAAYNSTYLCATNSEFTGMVFNSAMVWECCQTTRCVLVHQWKSCAHAHVPTVSNQWSGACLHWSMNGRYLVCLPHSWMQATILNQVSIGQFLWVIPPIWQQKVMWMILEYLQTLQINYNLTESNW